MVSKRQRSAGASGYFTPGVYPIAAGEAELVTDPRNAAGCLLLLNGTQSSYIDFADPSWLEFEYMVWMARAIEHSGKLTDPAAKGVLHLGAAACTMASYLSHEYPESRHVAVEFDQILAERVREWFPIPRPPKVKIRVGEARKVTESLTPATRSVVIRDVFADGAVPLQVQTVEAAKAVQKVLTPDGIYLVNVIDSPDLSNTRTEAATLFHVFDHVIAMADPAMLKGRRRGNVVLVASNTSLMGTPAAAANLTRLLIRGTIPATSLNEQETARLARGKIPLRDVSKLEPGGGDATISLI